MTHPLLRSALGAALLVSACATRAIAPPSNAHSPVSPAHPAGVTSSVTRALDEDPPLPGEDTTGWAGLDPNASSDADAGALANPHAHHSPPPPGASAPPPPNASPPTAPSANAPDPPVHDHGQVHDGGAHHAH